MVRAEVGVASLLARRRAVGPADPGNLTLVVKTFERPHLLSWMLSSARRVFSGPVIVADDSEAVFESADPRVRVLAMPFDSGIGPGRNALIDAASTEFVWMADDDEIMPVDLDVARVVAYLQRNPEVDLVGGRVVNLPLWRANDYATSPLFSYRTRPRLPRGTLVDGLPVFDKVPNFYIARTESLRRVRYDDRLKRVDHRDFFTAARGALVSVYDPDLVCLHAPSFFDAHYQGFRMDTAADFSYLGDKWPATDASLMGGSVDIEADTAAQFHRAALQVVAGDLGITLAQSGSRSLGAIAVEVRPADRARLRHALRALGWHRHGRLVHPTWGAVVVRTRSRRDRKHAPDDPAWFAGLTGLRAGSQPGAGAPIQSTDAPRAGAGRDRVRWSERVGWVDAGDRLLAAHLPLGPVVELRSPGDVIWQLIGPGGVDVDDVPRLVRHVFPDAPADAERQVRDYVALLTRHGLLDLA